MDLNRTQSFFAVALFPATLPPGLTGRKFPGAYSGNTTITVRISPLKSQGRELYKG